jgi:hypothetical protein
MGGRLIAGRARASTFKTGSVALIQIKYSIKSNGPREKRKKKGAIGLVRMENTFRN